METIETEVLEDYERYSVCLSVCLSVYLSICLSVWHHRVCVCVFYANTMETTETEVLEDYEGYVCGCLCVCHHCVCLCVTECGVTVCVATLRFWHHCHH